MSFISKRAKVVSDKPQYKEKIKTDTGYKWLYDASHISKRVKEKHRKLESLKKNLTKLEKQLTQDLNSDDLRTKAIAAIVKIIIETAMRVGNIESAKEADTYGATTLKLKHLTLLGNKAKFDFPGKKSVHQEQEITDAKVAKILKELIKDKKDNDFVFEIGGARIWDRAVNRYLQPFGVSAKDLRAMKANEIMKSVLKKHDWEEALKETAEIVGHTPNVLKNDYLDPSLVKKHEKTAGIVDDLIEKGKEWGEKAYEAGKEKLQEGAEWLKEKFEDHPTPKPISKRDFSGIKSNVQLNQKILDAWSTLKPFLPPGAVMTSGFRTETDQIRIINNYWQISRAYLDYPEVEDPTQRSRILKEYGYVVGPPRTTLPHGHLKGDAFDISGANLYDIAEAVNFVSGNSSLGTNLKPLIEPQNNAVHVTIYNSAYKPDQIAMVLGGNNRMAETDRSVLNEMLVSLAAAPYDFHPGQFPKICNCCGASYGEQEFLDLPFKEEEIGCYNSITGYDLLYRNCACDSTLVVKITCTHEQDAKDSKWEAEKDDPKWQEVLINKAGTKLTRKQIRDHYIKHADQILKEVKGKPVILYILTGPNQTILKRKHDDKDIVLNNKEDLEFWADRRLASVHRVLGPKTKLGFVDLDLHGDFPLSRAKDYAKKVAELIKDRYGVKATIFESGGTGLHIEFELSKEVDIDTLRSELKEMLDELNKNYDDVSTGLIKGSGMRSDISTLHSAGGIRAPYSLGETYGKIKKPL